jgi:hypothetical protein
LVALWEADEQRRAERAAMKRNYVFISLAVIAAGMLVMALLPKSWLGFTDSGEVIGTYYSYAGCEREVGKRGGWCGKGCMQYGDGSIANCSPLVKVSK